MLDMAQTGNGDRNMAKATHVQYMPTDEHISYEGLVLQKRILFYQPIHWWEATCSLSHTVAVEFYFSYKAAELTGLWSKLQKVMALSQKECDKEVKWWDRPVLYYQKDQPLWASHETKQSETTQYIIHKGPVCRQQAKLGHISSW